MTGYYNDHFPMHSRAPGREVWFNIEASLPESLAQEIVYTH